METLSLLDNILADWKLLVFAFGVGAFYYQGKIWFQRLTKALENTSKVHDNQNNTLDNINNKLENMDKRMARLEGSIEMITVTNNEQSVKIAVLESQTQIIDYPQPKRRIRKAQ